MSLHVTLHPLAAVTISFQPVEYNVPEEDLSVGIIMVKEGSSEIPVSVLLSTVSSGNARATGINVDAIAVPFIYS